MSLRYRVTFVLSVVVLASVLPPGTPPAVAFTEGASNNFFGTGAGDDPGNTGSLNSFFGGDAGTKNTTGSENSFFGVDAGRSNTTGSFNSFFGVQAGFSNTAASGNAFFGYGAGGGNTTGTNNAFFGRGAGNTNTTGGDNAFFGSEAGLFNTTGINDAFFGSQAGRQNTTGSSNSFFGSDSGLNNTTGINNAFFGTNAGLNNTTGGNNAFFGNNAGAFTTDCCNAFFGASAGVFNTTGGNNAFFGRLAGVNNTTGGNNVFVGHEAGSSNTTESGNTLLGSFSNGVSGLVNATAVGYRSQVSGANRLVLGSIAGLNGATSNVNVGIGTPTPAEPLHVRRTDGSAKVLVQEASGTLLGRELFELVNNGAARFRIENSDNGAVWDFQSSGGGGSFVIDRVGGPVSLDFELQPDGDAVFRGTVRATSFVATSDRNLKTDITPANARKLMSLLRQLDISTWRFKTEPKGKINLGPMAQDFHRLFGMGTDKTIDVRDLAALALVAAQALDDEARNQAAINNDQEKEIETLKIAVAELMSSR